nr:TPA_inf: conotoxin precursor O2 [Conus judaeus]
MEKLTILLLVAAVLMSTQALVERAGGNRLTENIKSLSRRKRSEESWLWSDCYSWLGSCIAPSQCCSEVCDYFCRLWR